MKKNPTWQKTVSWLVVSFIMIAGCTWWSSGNLWIGLLASATATPVKIVVYAIHEHVWGRFIFN